MPYPNSTAKQHNNNLHQNNSLMFQFIVNEYISASLEIDLITKKSPETHNGSISAVENSLQSLTGSIQEYMRFISWNLEEGILSKLKSYASLYAANSEVLHSKQLQLDKFAQEAWRASLESLEILRMIHDQKDNLSLYESLRERLSHLRTLFKKMGKLLADLLLEFSKDENVLYFILRNKEKLDHIFGSGFVKKTFLRMYPKGIEQAEEFVKRQYTVRGFDHLISSISSKFLELDDN